VAVRQRVSGAAPISVIKIWGSRNVHSESRCRVPGQRMRREGKGRRRDGINKRKRRQRERKDWR
jgi:hypothetical protein